MLLLPKEELRKLATQAESTYPSECCGLLIGVEGEERRVVEARPCLNATSTGAGLRYKIDPLVLLRTERELAGSEKVVLGIYHSHPDYPASPSKIDFDGAWPWYSYLVLSVKHGRFEEALAWRLAPNLTEFRSEELKILGDT